MSNIKLIALGGVRENGKNNQGKIVPERQFQLELKAYNLSPDNNFLEISILSLLE